MAAVRRVSEDPCLQSLTKLLAPGDVVGLFSTEQVPADRNLAVIAQKVVDQMVYERGEAAPISGVVVKLTPADVPEMLHLAELTKPGPFGARTIALGSYIGIRSGGQLVAMAGERMKFDGFTEISAVCSHPEHRGRGLSSLLVSTLMRTDPRTQRNTVFACLRRQHERCRALQETRLRTPAFNYSDSSETGRADRLSVAAASLGWPQTCLAISLLTAAMIASPRQRSSQFRYRRLLSHSIVWSSNMPANKALTTAQGLFLSPRPNSPRRLRSRRLVRTPRPSVGEHPEEHRLCPA